jgi:hypothetical protein
LEKEALEVLNEIIAKLGKNEKLIGIGAVVVAVAWLLGLIITSGWYGSSGAQTTGLLAVAAAVVAVVVLYLKYAPNTNITWPAPITTILLGAGAVAAIAGVLGLLQAVMYDPFGGITGLGALASQYGAGKPITIYLAAIGVVAGGAVMAYGAYLDYTASKTA